MGIDNSAAQLLYSAREYGVDFFATATLGKQHVFADEPGLSNIAKELNVENGARGILDACCRINGDRFIEMLGANSVTSFDASDYEGASVLHDMNEPIPEEFHQKFTAVVDGGTLEHIFNVPQALKNCLNMVSIGGHFISINGGNNFLGHGFYQLNPEFYFRTLSPENGFELVSVMLSTFRTRLPVFYLVKDPQAIGKRVELNNDQPVYTIALAKRTRIKKVFQRHPQQSDYLTRWQPNEQTTISVAKHVNTLRALSQIRALIPSWVKKPVRKMLQRAEPKQDLSLKQSCFKRMTHDEMMRGLISFPTDHG